MARATHSVRRGGFYSRGRSSRNTGLAQTLVNPQGTEFGYMVHDTKAGGRAIFGLWQGNPDGSTPTVQELLAQTPVRRAKTGDEAVSAASLSAITLVAEALAAAF